MKARHSARSRDFSPLGGELKDFYLTMGGYDAVAVVEAPSGALCAHDGLARRYPHDELRAFGEAEYRHINRSLP